MPVLPRREPDPDRRRGERFTDGRELDYREPTPSQQLWGIAQNMYKWGDLSGLMRLAAGRFTDTERALYDQHIAVGGESELLAQMTQQAAAHRDGVLEEVWAAPVDRPRRLSFPLAIGQALVTNAIRVGVAPDGGRQPLDVRFIVEGVPDVPAGD